MIYLWYSMNIKRIFMEYQRYIIIKKGKEQTQKCTDILTVCMTSRYDWNIPYIYHVYTIHKPDRLWYHSYISGIYVVYTTMYIPCLSFFIAMIYNTCSKYILNIYWYTHSICIASMVASPGKTTTRILIKSF